MDRFKELAVESYSTSLPCKFSFEITVVTGEPGDLPDGKVMLGTAVSDGKGAKRVDYCEKSFQDDSPIPLIWHSLYISPKEYFAAVQSGDKSSVRVLPKNESNPHAVNLSRIDPFDLVANPLGAVQKRQTPSLWERESRLVRHLENAEGNDALWFITPSEIRAFRLVFDKDDPRALNQFQTLFAPTLKEKHSQNEKRAPITRSDQLKGFVPICSVNVVWKEIEPIGILPQTIVATCGGYRANAPELRTDIQIKFFGYEFDPKKINFGVCDQASFEVEKLFTSLDVDKLQEELEKVQFKPFLSRPH